MTTERTACPNVDALVEACPLGPGEHLVTWVSKTASGGRVPVAKLVIPRSDDDDSVGVPQVLVPGDQGFDVDGHPEQDLAREATLSALVRAGLRHPGLSTTTLLDLHREAAGANHIELFADICAFSTGLLQSLVRSLGDRVSRIVVSSSSVDVLHEYQGSLRKPKAKDILRWSEMTRVLRALEDLRKTVPVHVYQLPPGASSYLKRRRAGTIEPGGEDEGPLTYVHEDRQMIAAFWDYLSWDHPRLPLRLVTADHRLAHVCSAERVPFVFAMSPWESWKRVREPLTGFWVDPHALSYRYTTAHEVLWELSLLFGELHVAAPQPEPESSATRIEFSRERFLPGEDVTLWISPVAAVPAPSPATEPDEPSKRASAQRSATDRGIKLAFTTLAQVLPTRPGQRVAVKRLGVSGEDSLRQLRHIGEETRLFTLVEGDVVGADGVEELLRALHDRDYLAVNAVFRRVARYDQVLEKAEEDAVFPKRDEAGAMTGWAISLGAAYKTAEGTRFGLAMISDVDFETAVIAAHDAVGRGQAAVPIASVLDRVCREKRMSPIRFEAMIGASLGKGRLASFEAQRAKSAEPISTHSVLVSPTTADPKSYLRVFSPGHGVDLGGKLVGSLVRRDRS